MLKKKTILIFGMIILLAGILMFIWAVNMFTYRGDYTKLMKATGEYSMVFWLPTSIVGFILTIIGLAKRKNL
jgi:hypothetical protein